MLIRGTVFHSSNCPGSLRETDLFTHCRKCAAINYHYYEPELVPDSDRSRGGREARGGVTSREHPCWGVQGEMGHGITEPVWLQQKLLIVCLTCQALILGLLSMWAQCWERWDRKGL